MICAALGGRAAEEMILGPENITTGAAGDLKKAREIASHMTEEWGMGEDQKEILRLAMEKTAAGLTANRIALDRVAQALMEKETLNAQEVLRLMEG